MYRNKPTDSVRRCCLFVCIVLLSCFVCLGDDDTFITELRQSNLSGINRVLEWYSFLSKGTLESATVVDVTNSKQPILINDPTILKEIQTAILMESLIQANPFQIGGFLDWPIWEIRLQISGLSKSIYVYSVGFSFDKGSNANQIFSSLALAKIFRNIANQNNIYEHIDWNSLSYGALSLLSVNRFKELNAIDFEELGDFFAFLSENTIESISIFQISDNKEIVVKNLLSDDEIDGIVDGIRCSSFPILQSPGLNKGNKKINKQSLSDGGPTDLFGLHLNGISRSGKKTIRNVYVTAQGFTFTIAKSRCRYFASSKLTLHLKKLLSDDKSASLLNWDILSEGWWNHN